MIPNKLAILKNAARPKTLPASIGPVLLSWSLVHYLKFELDVSVAIITLICAILLQISSNLINDYYDGIKGIDGEKRLGPVRYTHDNPMIAKFIKKAFISTLLLSLILGIYLMFKGGLIIVIIGLASLLFCFLYTGGPFPLSYYALGEVLALIFFGPVAVFGSFYLHTKLLLPWVMMIGFIPGFIAAAIMSINNLRDIESDSKTSKKTIAIFLGVKNARRFSVILAFMPIILIFTDVYVGNTPNVALLVILIFLNHFKTWFSLLNDSITEEFNLHLAKCGKYLFMVCLFMSITYKWFSL